MAKKIKPELVMTSDGHDLFMIFDGVKIAKRGQPGSEQAGQWISLEPGWTVHMTATETIVEFEGTRLQ